MRPAGFLVGLVFASACSTGAAPTGQPNPKTPSPSTPAERGAPNPATPRGGAVLYRPTPAALYALKRQDSLMLELPGGGTQLQEFARTAYLTVGIAEASAGYQATIRLDSIRQEPGGTGSIMSPDSMLRAEGTTWSGSLTIRTDAFDTKERSTTSYKVVKVDNKVYTIDAATGFQRTGTAGQGGQPMEMSSQGRRKSTYQFGADGIVLGAEGADSAEMTITVQAVGQTVPVHQRATWKISRK